MRSSILRMVVCFVLVFAYAMALPSEFLKTEHFKAQEDEHPGKGPIPVPCDVLIVADDAVLSLCPCGFALEGVVPCRKP